jgi:hypothetical protein
VLEHPQVFLHVGLLINEPPGPRPHQTSRVALYLVIRRTQLIEFSKRNGELQDAPALGVPAEIWRS